MPIELVMAQVGHISVEMTRYYTHLGNGARQAAVMAVQKKSEALVASLMSRPGGAPGHAEPL